MPNNFHFWEQHYVTESQIEGAHKHGKHTAWLISVINIDNMFCHIYY